MKQLRDHGDSRALGYCALCGSRSLGTKDHCPSKVFLDEPYPENLPAVDACSRCNNGVSRDEEYVACLISCVASGSTDPRTVAREKIARILAAKLALRARIERSRSCIDGRVAFRAEHGRMARVITKLAKGHAAYELHELCVRPPDFLDLAPVPEMDQSSRFSLESWSVPDVWPEVGSRALQRVLSGADLVADGWICVQPGRYRYRASWGHGVEVAIVIGEYLACRVRWSD